jgi:general secretion pathway protein J
VRRRSSQAGFTLIEVLISITVLAMLGTLIASGTRLGGRAWNSAERQTNGTDDVVLVQDFFRRTITRTLPIFATDDPRDSTVQFAGTSDTLELMAPQPGTQYRGPAVQERFYVGQAGGSRALFVGLRLDASPPSTAQKAVVVLDHVSQVRFGYFGSAGPGMPPAWQDSWSNLGRLPDLIRIDIVRDDPKLPLWPELIVGTRVTGNAGCIYNDAGTGCQRTR